MLNNYLDLTWKKLKKDIKECDPDFHLSDFNELLLRLEDLSNQYIRQQHKSLSNRHLLNGEVLEIITTDNDKSIKLVKMKSGQYLNCHTGFGISFGSNFNFQVEQCLKTSEGKQLGIIKDLYLLLPTVEHIALSRVFIGNFYKNPISTSLWNLYDYIIDHRPYETINCGEILTNSNELGINSLSLLTILNAAVNL
jgi:hypothetical protein